MLHYVKKFAMEIVPSVAATIIGAYIVNHYIAAKPAADAPAAAVVSTAKPKSKAESKADPKVEAKVDAKTETEAGPGGGPKADEQTDLAAIPASGVKAKGISEKAILEKNAAAEKGVVVEKPAEKVIDKPAETTASLPVEPRRQPQPPRERATAKLAPGPVQPVVATVPSESAAAQEERRDANDLARAAIERLRGSETPRAPEPARVQEDAACIDRSGAASAWRCEAATAADRRRSAVGESRRGSDEAALCRSRAVRRSGIAPDAAWRNPDRAAAA